MTNEFKTSETLSTNAKIIDYDLPFVNYRKTVKEDSTTGKKHVESKIELKKDVDSILVSSVVVVSMATGVNLICNGFSHLINAVKRKNR